MLAAVQYGVPVAQIYRAANNPLVDRMITRFRGGGGELIPKGTVAARRAIAALRRGAHLTMLADQKMNDGIPVPFFGRTAMTPQRSLYWRCASTATCCRRASSGSPGRGFGSPSFRRCHCRAAATITPMSPR